MGGTARHDRFCSSVICRHACAGESEAKVRQLFQEAAASAPCIVFIGAPRRLCRIDVQCA